jgi:anaphase-promoting complex subunit 8
MWSAMGGCYEKMRKTRDAAKCYERAELLKDSEGIALFKLARLYVSMGEVEKAASCYEENLTKKDEEKCDEMELIESHRFLAKLYKA